jgi:hypothetical protein
MSNGAVKGASFERAVCKQLSLWWTHGERDDVFWRTSQSGGRATQRAKVGKSTSGSYGDITSLDPSGIPLLRTFTFELKRGKSHGRIWDLLEAPTSVSARRFSAAIEQAMQSSQSSKSYSWALIWKEDRKECMICFPTIISVTGAWRVMYKDEWLFVMRLKDFFSTVNPNLFKR